LKVDFVSLTGKTLTTCGTAGKRENVQKVSLQKPIQQFKPSERCVTSTDADRPEGFLAKTHSAVQTFGTVRDVHEAECPEGFLAKTHSAAQTFGTLRDIHI
jgi:hypothetical protein